MTITLQPARSSPESPASHPQRRRTRAATAVALVASGVLLLSPSHPGTTTGPPTGPVALATAWPHAQRADIPGNLPDGPVFTPGLFLDARTALGVAPSPEGRWLRLLIWAGGGAPRELRRLPNDRGPAFDNFTATGDEIAWTERINRGSVQIWAADWRDGSPARRLTADAGNALFYGSQYDLVIADGAIHWPAASPRNDKVTQIRSVLLTGGPVRTRDEPGDWALTAWPWLTDGNSRQTGTTRLRNLATHRDIPIESTGAELSTCSPVWCRVMVMNSKGLIRVDLMHPDGTVRRRIAGSNVNAAIADVAVLDRFEILAQALPDSGLTGTARLLIYDIAARRTIDISAAVTGAFSRNGVLWWSTGDQDSIIWHTLDLRTV
jgi:hypothetical protein